MDFPYKIIVVEEKETKKFAKEFSKILRDGDIVALNGDLGCGKTFFVINVCKAFGIENVTSPTFAIVYEYSGKKKIYHFDFFRIKKIEELYDIGFEEYLSDNEAVTFIEWAELIPEIIPGRRYQITFKYIDESKREITVEKYE